MPPQPTATAKRPAGPCRADVERRVADVGRVGRVGVEPCERLEQRVGVWLVALRVLGADHDVHRVAQDREAVEREPDGAQALRRHDPERPALLAESREQREDADERLELGVERLVVRPVHVDELVDAFGVEVAHLRDQAGAADRGPDGLLVRLPAEDGQRRVLHRGEDDRPRVDQRPVEVEEDDGEAHRLRS